MEHSDCDHGQEKKGTEEQAESPTDGASLGKERASNDRLGSVTSETIQGCEFKRPSLQSRDATVRELSAHRTWMRESLAVSRLRQTAGLHKRTRREAVIRPGFWKSETLLICREAGAHQHSRGRLAFIGGIFPEGLFRWGLCAQIIQALAKQGHTQPRASLHLGEGSAASTRKSQAARSYQSTAQPCLSNVESSLNRFRRFDEVIHGLYMNMYHFRTGKR